MEDSEIFNTIGDISGIMARLFVGFPVPSDVPSVLQQQFKNYDLSFPKSFHLTFKFLGDVANSKIPGVIQRLQQVQQPQITVAFGPLGMFSDHGEPRVLWIALQPEAPLQALQSAIDDALVPLFPRDKDYHPHVTLGRFKSKRNIFSLPSVLQMPSPSFRFLVKEFFLYESIPLEGRHEHKTLATIQLQP